MNERTEPYALFDPHIDEFADRGSKQSALGNAALYRSGQSARHWRSFQQFPGFHRQAEALCQIAAMLKNPLHLIGCPAHRRLVCNRVIQHGPADF